MKHRISFLLLIVLIINPFVGFSHAVPTHTNITREAVMHLKTIVPEFSCLNDSALQIGTAEEDNHPRYIFHFLPNLTAVSSTCSSLQWGFFSDSTCRFIAPLPPPIYFAQISLTNDHTWADAIEHAKDPITGQPSEEGLKDLGYILHLLEDLTSPAHTRNDAHPPGDGDPVEAETRTPTMPYGNIISFATPVEFFTNLQEYTRSNFYSKDTCFTPPGPIAVGENQDYFFDSGRNKIAYKGPIYRLTKIKTQATIDDVIAEEQFRRLGPIAVQYAASFLFHYFAQTKIEINVVKNGGFEASDLTDWQTMFVKDGAFPEYAGPDGPYVKVVSEEKREGRNAVRIGRWDTPYRGGGERNGPPQEGVEPAGTDILYQEISLPKAEDLPPDDKHITLKFSYNIKTYDAAVYSWFDVDLLDAQAGNILANIVEQDGQPGEDWGIYYTSGWKDVVFDLTQWAGRKVRLRFSSHQDGYGDQFTTYVDRIVVKCGKDTATLSQLSSPEGKVERSEAKSRGINRKEAYIRTLERKRSQR